MVKFARSASVAQHSPVWMLGVHIAPSSSHAEVASRIELEDVQLEYPAMYWGFGEEKKEEGKKRLATDVSPGGHL